MYNKWEFPTENVIGKYFDMREELDKFGKKCEEDLAAEKEILKKLEEIKQRREAFRILSVKFSNLKHIIKNARPPKETSPADPQFIIDREKTMYDIQTWKDKNESSTLKL